MVDLVPVVDDPRGATDESLVAAFTALVEHPEYPCLGARSVFRRDLATIRVYDELGSGASAAAMLADVRAYVAALDLEAGFASFVALFRSPDVRGEEEFERLLWSHLELLHEADREAWSADVASDPEDPHFAFSLGGTPFFVVGLHPRASRDARRAPVPVLVLNLHQQFEELRASGRFERMRDTIRQRDTELQGSTNPMVDDHGGSSEARQYSGRALPDDWAAPFEEDS